MYAFVLYFLIICRLSAHAQNYEMAVNNLKLSKCDSAQNYSLTVEHVRVEMIAFPKVWVSGSLSSLVDLLGPVTAELRVERKELGIWFPIPCERKVGSCTYDDLCDFGVPKSKDCPAKFTTNGVPCRCPILKGNYTIKPTQIGSLLSQHMFPKSIVSGTYWGQVNLRQNKTLLACYTFQFDLDDNRINIDRV